MKKTFMLLIVCLVAMTCSSFTEAPIAEETVKVTAEAGDTVWDIAREQYAKGETRCLDEFVWAIRKQNGLTGNKVLQAGQELTIVIHKRK